MKHCQNCNKRKRLAEFGQNKFFLRYGAKDGINTICKACARERVYAGRKLKRAAREAAKALKLAQRKAEQEAEESRRLAEAVQLKLFVETQIRLLTRNGASRSAIKEATKAPWDLVTDVLAEMWDRGEVRIKPRGDERVFYLRRAA